MENKIIILNNKGTIYSIDKEVLRYNCISSDIFEEYDYSNCNNWEDIHDQAMEYVWEYTDNYKMPIYTKDINEGFNRLFDWEVDEICENYSITYNGDFEEFKKAVLFYSIYNNTIDDLSTVLECIEVEY